jgi:F0F1-type ATP synthase assembly protein I
MTEETEKKTDSAPSAADLGIQTDLPKSHGEAVTRLADAMLRYAIWPAVATVVVGIVVASVLHGVQGGVSALIGGIVAFGSSMATWWLMRKTAALNPMMVMTGALGGFVGKMIILLLVLMVLREITWLHTTSLAYTMLAVVIVWAAMDTVAFRRTKLPTLIITDDDQ